MKRTQRGKAARLVRKFARGSSDSSANLRASRSTEPQICAGLAQLTSKFARAWRASASVASRCLRNNGDADDSDDGDGDDDDDDDNNDDHHHS